MERDRTKLLRPAAGVTLMLSLALAVQAIRNVVMPAGPEGHGAAEAAGAFLAVAVFLGALWIFLLARTAAPAAGPAPSIQAAAPPPPKAEAAEPGAEALMLVALLQEKGRFVDFVMEDISSYTNDQVGAAARVVHQGCRAVIADAFAPLPVAPMENARMTLEPGYDAEEFRLVGRAEGSPPFTVKVTHKGWRARHVKLPRRMRTDRKLESPIIVPAEVAA